MAAPAKQGQAMFGVLLVYVERLHRPWSSTRSRATWVESSKLAFGRSESQSGTLAQSSQKRMCARAPIGRRNLIDRTLSVATRADACIEVGLNLKL